MTSLFLKVDLIKAREGRRYVVGFFIILRRRRSRTFILLLPKFLSCLWKSPLQNCHFSLLNYFLYDWIYLKSTIQLNYLCSKPFCCTMIESSKLYYLTYISTCINVFSFFLLFILFFFLFRCLSHPVYNLNLAALLLIYSPIDDSKTCQLYWNNK